MFFFVRSRIWHTYHIQLHLPSFSFFTRTIPPSTNFCVWPWAPSLRDPMSFNLWILHLGSCSVGSTPHRLQTNPHIFLGGGNSNIFYFHPYLGKVPILTNMFQRGWNHQLVFCFWKKLRVNSHWSPGFVQNLHPSPWWSKNPPWSSGNFREALISWGLAKLSFKAEAAFESMCDAWGKGESFTKRGVWEGWKNPVKC